MIKAYTGIYIKYSLIFATAHPLKYTPTSAVLATKEKISLPDKFISCHYTVQFLTLSLIKETQEVKYESKKDR